MKVQTAIGLLMVSAAASGSASAGERDWYIGLGAGGSQSRLDDDRLIFKSGAPGFGPTAILRKDVGEAYQGFAGFDFSRHFALEGSYFDLGKFSFQAPTAPSGSLAGTVRVRGFGLDAVGKLPFTAKFSAFGKIGASDARTRDSLVATAANSVADPNPGGWHVNPKVGAGLQYDFAPHFALRGEWNRYRIADAVRDHGNVDAWFVSVVIPFGRTPPAPVAITRDIVVELPASVIVAAPPPPPPPQPLPPPPPRRVSFSADALFAFGSSNVRAEGMRELDRFVEELRGTTFDRISVLGYTDRIGSEAFNLRLSQQRADAVKNYLVRTGGVNADKISADGRGATDPVTKRGDCGPGRSAAIIACLQPDRRVEIEVAGRQR